jgi:hypothetical protein
MRKLLAIALLGLCSCDANNSSGPVQFNGSNWTQIAAPTWGTQSGLYKTIDPDNGNIIYLHIGYRESSLYVVKAEPKK